MKGYYGKCIVCECKPVWVRSNYFCEECIRRDEE